MASELEVDEGLDIGGLDLDDKPNEGYDEESLDEEGKADNEGTGHAREGFGQPVEQIAEEHKESHSFVRSTPLEEYLWLELTPYLMKHFLGDSEGGGAEEHPQGCDEVEGDETTDQPTQGTLLRLRIVPVGQAGEGTEDGTDGVPNLVEAEEHAVDAAPKNEVERGSMPQTTEEHGDEEIEVLAELAMPVAA